MSSSGGGHQLPSDERGDGARMLTHARLHAQAYHATIKSGLANVARAFDRPPYRARRDRRDDNASQTAPRAVPHPGGGKGVTVIL